MLDFDPSTRPFSPSPPRENRHTASRPPSLLLSASLTGTLAPSNHIDLAGLPATPPHSQQHPHDNGINYFVGHSHAAGEFAHRRRASLKSEKHRRESDSSTSSSSPPLGATSLLASLADPPAQGQQGFTTPKHDMPEVAMGTPDSARSIDSALSATSQLLSTSKSFPRLHQPTVVRSSSGRGLAFLPPPAQISPSNSTFSLHQPLDERHQTRSTRDRAGSHSSTMSDDPHSLSLVGGYGHTRATSLASTGQTVVQRLTSLAETFPERPASRITNASMLRQDAGAENDVKPYTAAVKQDIEPKTLKSSSIVILPRPDISSQSASVHSFNVEDDNKSDSETSFGRTSPEHEPPDPNPTLPDYAPEPPRVQAPTSFDQLEFGTQDHLKDDLSINDGGTSNVTSGAQEVAAMAGLGSYQSARSQIEPELEAESRQMELELQPASSTVLVSLDTGHATVPLSSDTRTGDDMGVLGAMDHEKSMDVLDFDAEPLEKALTPVKEGLGTDVEYLEGSGTVETDETVKESEQIQDETVSLGLKSESSTSPTDSVLTDENLMQAGPQEVQEKQDQYITSDHEKEVESESFQANNQGSDEFKEPVYTDLKKENEIINSGSRSAVNQRSQEDIRFESLEAIGPEDSELTEQLHEVPPKQYAYDMRQLGAALNSSSIPDHPSFATENEKCSVSTATFNDTNVLPYTPRKGARCFPATIHSDSESDQNRQLPFAISLYTTISTSQPVPQLATQRLELNLAWLNPAQNSLLRYIPASRLIPSWNVKYVTGSKDHPVVFDPRSFVKNVIERIPIVRRFSSWL